MRDQSGRDQRGERPHGANEADRGHQQRATERRSFEGVLLRLLRRTGDGDDIADEQRPAKSEHEPGEEVVTEEHALRMAASRWIHTRRRTGTVR
jgi:hypothetical protein